MEIDFRNHLPSLPVADDVRRAVAQLRSPGDGDRAVIDVVACGGRAIPPLARLLFECDQSGILEPRLRAVSALAALGARDTLLDFLAAPHVVADPVAQLGEEAIVSAVARVLDDTGEERAFGFLMALAQSRMSPGVAAALGRSLRKEAIPELIRALGEDEARGQAEMALSAYGGAARPALLAAAAQNPPEGARESESHLRQRRSALKLLIEIAAAPDDWHALRRLMTHPDPQVAARACEIALVAAPADERREAEARLGDIARNAEVLLADEIGRRLGARRHGE